MKRIFLSVLTLFIAFSAVSAQETQTSNVTPIKDVPHQGSYTPSFKNDGISKKPVNVILMIGDGMGMGAVSSAMFSNGNELTMTNLHSIGWSRTQSASSLTTDSAASGSAYATGNKVKNGTISMDSEGNPLPSIPEILSKKGIISGVVTTDQLTGATPAVFYAHRASRKDTKGIWADLAGSKLVFAAGGSLQAYNEVPSATRNEIEKNYTVVNKADDPSVAASGKLVYLPDRHDNTPGSPEATFLPEATNMAIKYLSDRCAKKKGFFLMVEGSKIDGAAHGNKGPQLVNEVLYFDRAVTEAIKFAEKDGNTLVIITADHETGGIALSPKGTMGSDITTVFTTKSHSCIPVPVFAYGPCSGELSRVQENSDISRLIVKLLSK